MRAEDVAGIANKVAKRDERAQELIHKALNPFLSMYFYAFTIILIFSITCSPFVVLCSWNRLCYIFKQHVLLKNTGRRGPGHQSLSLPIIVITQTIQFNNMHSPF